LDTIDDNLEPFRKTLRDVTWTSEAAIFRYNHASLIQHHSDEIACLQRRIDRDAHACGCSEGAAALFVTLLAITGLTVRYWHLVRAHLAIWSGVAIALAIMSIAVGKAFGKRIARRRLQHTKALLQAIAASNGGST